jgi:prophage antirepressor-like protein
MQPQLFNFKGQQVRTLTINNEPYFIGKDVGSILGYARTADAIKAHVDDEDKLTRQFTDSGQKRSMTVINESGLYSLIISSKLPQAHEFKRWVTSEVLPTIRKHGAYMTPAKIEEVLTDPDTIIQLATQLKQEREGRLIAEQKVNELTPKATYYDKVLADKSLVTITQIAKDYGMSGRAMNKKLHELKVIYKQGQTWLLYAKYQKTGWTHSETVMVPKKDGTEKAVLNTKWTQQGRLGLYELLKCNGIIPLIEQD